MLDLCQITRFIELMLKMFGIDFIESYVEFEVIEWKLMKTRH